MSHKRLESYQHTLRAEDELDRQNAFFYSAAAGTAAADHVLGSIESLEADNGKVELAAYDVRATGIVQSTIRTLALRVLEKDAARSKFWHCFADAAGIPDILKVVEPSVFDGENLVMTPTDVMRASRGKIAPGEVEKVYTAVRLEFSFQTVGMPAIHEALANIASDKHLQSFVPPMADLSSPEKINAYLVAVMKHGLVGPTFARFAGYLHADNNLKAAAAKFTLRNWKWCNDTQTFEFMVMHRRP